MRKWECGMRNRMAEGIECGSESAECRNVWQRILNAVRPGLRLAGPTPRRVRLIWFRLLSLKLIVLIGHQVQWITLRIRGSDLSGISGMIFGYPTIIGAAIL